MAKRPFCTGKKGDTRGPISKNSVVKKETGKLASQKQRINSAIRGSLLPRAESNASAKRRRRASKRKWKQKGMHGAPRQDSEEASAKRKKKQIG